MRYFLIVALMTGMSLLFSTGGLSCPIPVFRYALEYWEADEYRLEIFHDGPLSAQQQELVRHLLSPPPGDGMKANLDLRIVNLEGNVDEVTLSYLKKLAPPSLPWMVLRYPRVSGIDKVIWSGSLTRANVEGMLNSPVRESIAGSIIGGATAVWVLLESGDRRKDRESYEMLERTLRRLEQTLVLPDLDLWWGNVQGSEDKIPEINFDIVRVSRDDQREEFFVAMLLNSEADLEKYESEAMVFPFYGRGIALWTIIGKGINEWNIREAAEFITGPCSCQAKLLNPGVDMLFAMDWDRYVEHLSDISIANPLSGMGDFANREEEARSLLESAAIRRLGIDINNSRRLATEPSRVVYLDIPGAGTGSTDSPVSGEGSASGDTGGTVAGRADAGPGTAPGAGSEVAGYPRSEVARGPGSATGRDAGRDAGDRDGSGMRPGADRGMPDETAPAAGPAGAEAAADLPGEENGRRSSPAGYGMGTTLRHILLAVSAVVVIVLVTGIILYKRTLG